MPASSGRPAWPLLAGVKRQPVRNLFLVSAFFVSTLFGSFTAAQAAMPLPVSPASASPSAQGAPAPHPVVGSWSWKLQGKACTETVDYRVDGSRSGSSGEETLQGRYDITPLPSLLGFYRVVESVTTANAKRDCSGDLHEASDPPVTRFIQFNPKRDQLIICKAESLQACFGPLKRVQN
jgi:hypothetical protein